jgi:hypothetical protein
MNIYISIYLYKEALRVRSSGIIYEVKWDERQYSRHRKGIRQAASYYSPNFCQLGSLLAELIFWKWIRKSFWADTGKGFVSMQVVLCKIWGFLGGDYDELCILGFKIPFRTSQETYYFSSVNPSWLMLYKAWGFQSNGYEECRLLWYKKPFRTSQETLLLRLRAQPVNAM